MPRLDISNSPIFLGPFPEEGVCVQDAEGQVEPGDGLESVLDVLYFFLLLLLLLLLDPSKQPMQVRYLERKSLEELMSCHWASHLLLEDQRLLKARH